MGFTSKRADLLRKNAALKDMTLGHMAADIERIAKQNVPVKTGALRAEIRHFRNADGAFRVEANKEYAAYQERGMRASGSHVVKHYSTSGTGKGWFKKAIDNISRHANNYIDEAAKALGL